MNRRFKRSITALLSMLLLAGGHSWWTISGGDIREGRVIVSKVYDGDTVVVGRGWRKTTVRLIGVDTPEISHPDRPVEFYGPEAADFARQRLEGRWVQLELEPGRPGGDTDRYGRTLAYVITEDGKNFNLELVRLGYGRAYTKFPFKYQREFKTAEMQARAEGLGIWSRTKKETWSDPDKQGKIIGNIRSRIYHLPGQYGYDKVSEKNRIYFDTEEDARKAGFRKATR